MKNDVSYLAILLGLFVLAFLLVVACDRIIASDREAVDAAPLDATSPAGDTEQVAA